MTSTLRVTASNKFTLFDLKTRQIAVRNAFWKGSFVLHSRPFGIAAANDWSEPKAEMSKSC
jgi:hypothetical protein